MPIISASLGSSDQENAVWNVTHGPSRLTVSFFRAQGDAVEGAEKWKASIALPALDITFDDSGPTKAEAFAKALVGLKTNGVKRGSPVLDLRAIQAELTRKGAFRSPR